MICFLYRAGLAALFTLQLASTASAAPVYNFSPVNQTRLQLVSSFWHPIVQYVSRRSGVQLNLKLGRTAGDTTALAVNGEVDFAYTNHLFSPQRAQLGWSVFGRRQGAPVQAQIVVPADSPLSSLDQLAGSTVVFPSPEAMLGYKLPYAELLRARLAVEAEFAGNTDAAFAQLFSGRARAAGASSLLVQNYARREGKALRVLWQSAPLNELALMASPRVPAQQVQAVARAFFGMRDDPEGRRILDTVAALVHTSMPLAFIPAADADFAAYREFYASAPAALR